MNVNERNEILLRPGADLSDALPHLAEIRPSQAVRLRGRLRLPVLPAESGFLAVRGARQYGKSTWLESQIEETIARFGPGSALYLNGDEIAGPCRLIPAVRALRPLFAPKAGRGATGGSPYFQGGEHEIDYVLDAGEFLEVKAGGASPLEFAWFPRVYARAPHSDHDDAVRDRRRSRPRPCAGSPSRNS